MTALKSNSKKSVEGSENVLQSRWAASWEHGAEVVFGCLEIFANISSDQVIKCFEWIKSIRIGAQRTIYHAYDAKIAVRCLWSQCVNIYMTQHVGTLWVKLLLSCESSARGWPVYFIHIWTDSSCYPPVLSDGQEDFLSVCQNRSICGSAIWQSCCMWPGRRPRNQAYVEPGETQICGPSICQNHFCYLGNNAPNRST